MTDALNVYLCTNYRYHMICMTCGAVTHPRAGVDSGECEHCGGDCWKSLVAKPSIASPWYVQYLDPACPTCQHTLSDVTRLGYQMELFKTT